MPQVKVVFNWCVFNWVILMPSTNHLMVVLLKVSSQMSTLSISWKVLILTHPLMSISQFPKSIAIGYVYNLDILMTSLGHIQNSAIYIHFILTLVIMELTLKLMDKFVTRKSLQITITDYSAANWSLRHLPGMLTFDMLFQFQLQCFINMFIISNKIVKNCQHCTV